MDIGIRYLEIQQINFSRIIIKDNAILYKYPDNVVKKLYIKTPFVTIIRSRKENGIHIDITFINSFFENLKEKLGKEYLYNHFESEQQNIKINVNQKTEFIIHNISDKYEQIERVTNDINNRISNLNKKRGKEAMIIFTPVIFEGNNRIVFFAHSIEIKYKKQYIKSIINKQEQTLNYVIPKLEIEL